MPRSSPIVATLFVVGLAVALLIPLPTADREATAALDLVHAPVFAVLAWIVFTGCRRWLPGNDFLAAAIVWLIVVAGGVGAEFAQGLTGRGPTISDAVANAIGAAAGLLWALRRRWRGFAVIAVLLLFLAGARPLAQLGDAALAHWQMPLLGSFEYASELMRWDGNGARLRRVREHASEGEWALQMELYEGQYPGAILAAPPGDWSGYRELLMDLTLDGGSPIPCEIKIQDDDHNWSYVDCFHRTLTLLAGKSTVRISLADVEVAPQGRRMDMRAIAQLQIFTRQLDTPRRLVIDNVRLQ